MVNIWGARHGNYPDFISACYGHVIITILYPKSATDICNKLSTWFFVCLFVLKRKTHNWLILLPCRQAVSSNSWALLYQTEEAVDRMQQILGSPKGSLDNGVCPQVGTALISLPIHLGYLRSIYSFFKFQILDFIICKLACLLLP